jgi:hypothetical protein
MQTWRDHMPEGMLLKAEGFASNLADPAAVFTLEYFCELSGIPYDETRIPIRLETFRAYGLAFQQRMIPEVEDTQVVRIERDAAGFRLNLSDGRYATAPNVVLGSASATSIPGLYVVGFASKYCFGPVMQFACGAHWTAARISRRLAKLHRRGRISRCSPLIFGGSR